MPLPSRLPLRSHLVATVLAIGVLAISLAGGTLLWLTRYQPDRQLHPVRGIDVSHHQGKIDWRAVAADDVAFAYLKASEGGDYVDPAFADNRRQARAAGVKIGAYHFFTFCRSGGDQAQHFLAVLGAAKAASTEDDLPPALDLEFGGNCATRPSPAVLKAEIADFTAIVEHATGRLVIIYATDEALAAYGPLLPHRALWVRAVFSQPRRPDWALWQYQNLGQVHGIIGRVDLNVACGDLASWRDRWPACR